MIHAKECVSYELWSVTVMGTPGNYLISAKAFLIVMRGTLCSFPKGLNYSYTEHCDLFPDHPPPFKGGFLFVCLNSEITGSEAVNILSLVGVKCSLPPAVCERVSQHFLTVLGIQQIK